MVKVLFPFFSVAVQYQPSFCLTSFFVRQSDDSKRGQGISLVVKLSNLWGQSILGKEERMKKIRKEDLS
jgi:hypothetical protein